jgi:dolichyl-phosphate beta-glucosyltransferase
MNPAEQYSHTAGSVFLSVVIPAYNEEKFIEKTLTKIASYLNVQSYEWEVIVVDDASTDSTVARIKQFISQQTDNKVRLLINEKNRQKGATIRRGVLATKGKYAVFLDADYAYPIDQIDNFLSHLENGVHIVIGDRTDPGTTYFVKPSSFSYIYQRYLLSRIFNTLVRLLLVKGIHDTQCGMKAFQTKAAKAVFEKISISSFAFDVEMLYIAQQNGRKIVQVPVTFNYIDEPSSVRLFKHSLVMFRSLVQIKFNAWRKIYVLNPRFVDRPRARGKD